MVSSLVVFVVPFLLAFNWSTLFLQKSAHILSILLGEFSKLRTPSTALRLRNQTPGHPVLLPATPPFDFQWHRLVLPIRIVFCFWLFYSVSCLWDFFFFHTVEYNCRSFSLVQCFFVWIYHSSFIHWTIRRSLGRFPVWGHYEHNGAAVSILIPVFWWMYVVISARLVYLGVELTAVVVQTVFCSGCPGLPSNSSS